MDVADVSTRWQGILLQTTQNIKEDADKLGVYAACGLAAFR